MDGGRTDGQKIRCHNHRLPPAQSGSGQVAILARPCATLPASMCGQIATIISTAGLGLEEGSRFLGLAKIAATAT